MWQGAALRCAAGAGPLAGLALCLLPACSPAPPPRPPVQFAEVTAQAGIDFVHYNGAQGDYYYVETFGSGAAFFDYDGDGWQDLFLANGCFLSGQQPATPPTSQLYRNQRDGTFADATSTTGIGHQGYAMGCAAADYDEDGDEDLLVTTEAGPPRLLRNDGGNQTHWLSVALTGKAPRDALGARVTVEAGGVRQVRQRQSGRSYLASHDPRLHFGLGEHTQARVEVRWPSGQVQQVGEVAADQFLTLEEP